MRTGNADGGSYQHALLRRPRLAWAASPQAVGAPPRCDAKKRLSAGWRTFNGLRE